MYVYNLLLTCSIVSVILSLFNNKKLTNVLFLLTSFFALVIVAFRHETIGTDTIGYYDFFIDNTIGRSQYVRTELEVGYVALSSFLRTLTDDGNLFLALCAFVSIIPLEYVIWNESKNKCLSIFFFLTLGTTTTFFILFFSMVRQCLAFGIMTVVLYLYYKGRLNLVKTIVLTLFVCLFHKTVLFMIPLLFIKEIIIPRKIALVTILISFAVGIFISKYVAVFTSISNSLFGGEFNYYTRLMEETSHSLGVTVPFSIIGILICMSSKDEFCNNLYTKAFFLGVVINNLFNMMGNSDRLCLYYLIYGCIVIPNYIQQLEIKRTYRLLFLFLLLFYYSNKYEKVLVNAQNNPITSLVPYKSILF